MSTPQTQKSRAGQSVDDRTVAKYTAARIFLAGMWAGGILLIGSFTLLYWLAFAQGRDGWPPIMGSLAIAVIGGWAFWRNRLYYHDLKFPFRRRLATIADVVAGSGAFFWILFGFLLFLSAVGVDLLPNPD